MTLSAMGIIAILSIMTLSIECYYHVCCNVRCFSVILMLNVVILSVVMLTVVALKRQNAKLACFIPKTFHSKSVQSLVLG